MKAIILAAGRGSRMGQFGMDFPKCLIEIKGKPILDYQLELLEGKNITDITIVIGAKGDCWTQNNYEKVRKRIKNTKINFENLSKKRNFSLAIGISEIDNGPLLIIDGDLMFNENILNAMLSSDGDVVLLSRDCEDINDSSNKLEVMQGRVIGMGPEVSAYPWKINAGFVKIGVSIFRKFKKVVFDSKYLEGSFNELIHSLCKTNNIKIVLANSGWVNINSPNNILLCQRTDF